MNRQEFTAARRLVRTFLSLCREVVAADSAGDATKFRHFAQWVHAVYQPQIAAIDAVRAWVLPGPALTTQLGMIRALPDQRADRIRHVRMSRYFRKPAPLPR